MALIDIAYKKARELVKANITPYGMTASVKHYVQVWARDLGISSLGALILNNKEIDEGVRVSLSTLAKYQSSRGAIPNYVSAQKKPVISYGIAGCSAIDAPLWFIINCYYYFKMRNADFIKTLSTNIESAMRWILCQDSNEDYLLEIPENSDWRDLFFYRHHVLYDEILFYAAVRAYDEMAKELSLKPIRISNKIKEAINTYMWINHKNFEKIKKWEFEHKIHGVQYYERYAIIFGNIQFYPFYLPYITMSEYGCECDTVGNTLAILFGVCGNEEKKKSILEYIDNSGCNEPYPLAVLDYPVMQGDKRWLPWLAKTHLNLPYQYHNGGIWLWVGGVYVSALVKCGMTEKAGLELEKLAKGGKSGKNEEWEFNEWHHKKTGKPMGSAHQLWSAAMYCYAYNAVKNGNVDVFQNW